jgi:hypothetical protein
VYNNIYVKEINMGIIRTTTFQDRDFKDNLIDRLCIAQDYAWVVEWVKDNFSLDDLFDFDTLSEWAKDNGFVDGKEE